MDEGDDAVARVWCASATVVFPVVETGRRVVGIAAVLRVEVDLGARSCRAREPLAVLGSTIINFELAVPDLQGKETGNLGNTYYLPPPESCRF